MKKKIFSLVFAACALLFAGTSCVKEFDTQLKHDLSPDTDVSQWMPVVEYGAVNLATYNVLYGAYNDSDNYKWATRKAVLAQSIVAGDFDIVGLQEVDRTIRQQLPALVAEAKPEGSTRNYQWWFTNRDRQDADSDAAVAAVGEGVGIMYDANKYTLSEKHYFWLSSTPDVVSPAGDRWGESAYNRQAICCVVTQNDDPEKRFFLMVTHAPLNQTARVNSATLLNSRAAQYNPGGLAAFLVGDMNAAPDDPSSAAFSTFGWSDAFKEVPASARSGGVLTFHGKKDITDMSNAENRIDYIYFKNKPKVLSYKVDYNKYNGYYPSDHCAVSVTFNIPSATPPPPSGDITGDGSAANPFRLTSVADWATVAASINGDGAYAADACYTLTADLQFAGDFVRIAEFSGVLDGAGHSMKGITGEGGAEKFGGVINILKGGGVVKNLHVESTLSSAYPHLGGVVGAAEAGSLIDGVTFRGNLTGTADAARIGGIVGTGYGVIVNCGCLGGEFQAGTATKSENMGGIAGRIEQPTAMMFNCYSWLDKIVSSQNNLGGVTGGLGTDAYCANVYGTTASITGGGTYGGCIGYSKSGNIRNVYTTDEAANNISSTLWVANDKEASDWLTTGASLALANMKSGAVTLPSSGVEYASFVEALNAGIEDWNALENIASKKGKDVKPYGIVSKPDVTLREWVADPNTGLPVVKKDESVTPPPPTPGGDPIAMEIVFKDYAEEHNWTVDPTSLSAVYTTVQQGVVTLTASGTGDNGVYNSPSYYDWRFYQARGGTLTVEVPEGYALVSVKFKNHEYKNGGCFYDASGNAGLDDVELPASGRTAVFTVGSQTGATNGQARITGITIKYLAPVTPDPGTGGGDSDPTVVSVNIRQYAAAHADVWTDNGGGTAYTIVENGITLTPNTSGTANGVWFVGVDSTPDDWRIYEARGGFTLSAPAGHSLVKAKFTFSYKGTNVSKLHYNEADYGSGEEIPLSGESAEFTVTSSAGAGQARISEFVVEYL